MTLFPELPGAKKARLLAELDAAVVKARTNEPDISLYLDVLDAYQAWKAACES